jgi:2-polyprenyl-6-hydroxyphenyl methylase/3-demethylubiquinone-9 3-methyltransferase
MSREPAPGATSAGGNRELTSPAYWDQAWQARDARSWSDLGWIRSKYSWVLLDHRLRARLPRDPGKRLLEVGCATGRWLIYFHRTFGYAVTGCDYSEAGCREARQNLARAGIAGDVVQDDLFRLEGRWDVVFSGGLIEHFTDAQGVLGKFASLLNPGGFLVTIVPNLSGLSGAYHRWLKPETFTTHRVVTAAQLRQWYGALGLRRIEVGALGSIVPARFPRDAVRRRHPRVYRALWTVLGPVTWTTNRACLWSFRRTGVRIESPRFSPYLYAIGEVA